MFGDATSDASSRLALQGGAVAAWSRGCLVGATWLRVELVIVGQTCDCGYAEHSGVVGVHVSWGTCGCYLLYHMCPVYVFLDVWGRDF